MSKWIFLTLSLLILDLKKKMLKATELVVDAVFLAAFI